MEAVTLGARLLLIDEDRSATNFMIRDAVMKELIEKEPITPFTDRVRELAGRGVSTVLVIGGSGAYLSVADRVYMMDDFVMGDATARAKALATSVLVGQKLANWENNRTLSGCFSSYPSGATREKLEVSDTGFIIIGDERIDIRCLHDIATEAQINALAFMLRYLANKHGDTDALEGMAMALRGLKPAHKRENKIDITKKAGELFADVEANGLNLVDTGFFAVMGRFMDMPRPFELLAAINRMRHVAFSIDDSHVIP
jgi:hypothetical protein